MKISWNVAGDSNDQKNFPHKLLLTKTQASRICKAFVNGSSAKVNLLKTQFHKIGHWGWFLAKLLGLLLKTGLPFIGNVLKPLDH